MTQDEIIELAVLAEFEMDDSGVLSPQVVWYIYQESLIKFAKLVAAKEREACAKFIENDYVRQFENPWREDLTAAIRNRGDL